MKKQTFYFGLFMFAVFYAASCFTDRLGNVEPTALKMVGLIVLMAIFWLGEAIPLAATSIIPLFALPMLGIMSSKDVATAYGANIIWLFMTGFFIARAIEKWGLHRRIANYIISTVGFSPSRLVGGFLISTAAISCFISNTATALMMLPIGLSVLKAIGPQLQQGKKAFGTALMLAIAFGANIGGMGTPIGSPPNLIFLGVLQESFPTLREISFATWVAIALPIVLFFLALTWFYLVKTNPIPNLKVQREFKLPDNGPMSRGEMLVGVLFAIAVILWMTRADINLGSFTVTGWASALGLSKFVKDTAVGALICVALFTITVRDRDRNITPLLDWDTAKQIPWDILLLFGGGIALSKGIVASGLSASFAHNLEFGLKGLPVIVEIMILCVFVSFLTEITSNTAMTSLMMPILATISPLLDVDPALLMMPAALSASCAFMFPVATPPNAIVYSQNYFSIATMAKTGLTLNIIGVILVSFGVFFLGNALQIMGS